MKHFFKTLLFCFFCFGLMAQPPGVTSTNPKTSLRTDGEADKVLKSETVTIDGQTFTRYNHSPISEVDKQTLSWNKLTKILSIENGNDVTLSDLGSGDFVDFNSNQTVFGIKTFINQGGAIRIQNSVNSDNSMTIGQNGGTGNVFRLVPFVAGNLSTADRLEYNYDNKTWNAINGNFLIGGQTPLFNSDLPRIGARTTLGSGDFNTVVAPGWHDELLSANDLNGPTTNSSTSFFQKWVIEYNSQNGSGNLTELLFPYSNSTSQKEGIFYRGRLSGNWGTWYELWGSGNDGTNSGLDADLFDGQESEFFLNYNNFTNIPSPFWIQTGNDLSYLTGNIGIGVSTPDANIQTSSAVNGTLAHFETSSGGSGKVKITNASGSWQFGPSGTTFELTSSNNADVLKVIPAISNPNKAAFAINATPTSTNEALLIQAITDNEEVVRIQSDAGLNLIEMRQSTNDDGEINIKAANNQEGIQLRAAAVSSFKKGLKTEGPLILDGVVSYTGTATFNGGDLTGLESANTIELTPLGGDIIFTGLLAPIDGSRVHYTIANLGNTDEVIFQGSNGASDPEDQFAHSGDIIIPAGRMTRIYYNPTKSRYISE